MPVVMAILTFLQNKMTIKDPNQKAMIYFMPVFMLVLFNNFPAGLVFYWTFSNALGILQQYILNKSMEKEQAAFLVAAEKKQLVNKKGKK
jgi:YidC/Oxa1 family membrane protein insertase